MGKYFFAWIFLISFSGFLLGGSVEWALFSPTANPVVYPSKEKSETKSERQQQKETYWERVTDPIAVYTLVLMIFTGVLAWSTLGLQKETRRLAEGAEAQAKDMKSSIAAAQTAADAAKKSAEISENTILPYLLLDVVSQSVSTELREDDVNGMIIKVIVGLSQQPSVSFRFTNYGRTPAIIRRLRPSMCTKTSAPDPRQTWYMYVLPSARNIAADKSTADMEIPLFLGDDDISAIETGDNWIWFYGLIEFGDVWGNEYFTEWCWRFDSNQRVLVPYDEDRKRNRCVRVDRMKKACLILRPKPLGTTRRAPNSCPILRS